MSTQPWNLGDRVRFVGDYVVPASVESAPLPQVKAGAQGVVVKVKADSIWVEVAGVKTPVTLWFPGAFPDEFAKIDLIERLK